MSQSPVSWKLRSRSLEFGERPLVMGIVNVTPDSFSDGGNFFAPELAVDQCLRLEDQGADILDIGGESTRPYSTPVTEAEEIARVSPVISAIADRVEIPISIDTSKSQVALAAIGLGAEIINDVTGFEGDPRMSAVAAESGAGICAMHMQGTPQNMQDAPSYEDVVEDVFAYLQARVQSLIQAGIQLESICLDPGIGFGKTFEHNLQLIRSAESFLKLDRPILVGHSRKGFVAKIIGNKQDDRLAGTLAFSLLLAQKGMHILRVHDVKETVDALKCWRAGSTTSP